MGFEQMDFGGMKRKELQALCKKHSIPANLTNAEMAKRLRALASVEGKAGALKRTVLKSSNEKGSENESDVEIKQPKKVRFGLENQMFEFEKSEVKYLGIKGRGRPKSIFSRENIVESIHGVIEKKGVKDDILQKKLGSSIDNVASSDSGNGDHRVVTRKSLRNKKVEDDRMGEMEDLVNGSHKSVVEIDEEVVEMRERDRESRNAQPEKVFRRSKRNAAHVEDPKLLTIRASETEVVERGKSRNMIAATRTNGSEAEIDVNIVAKTGLSAGENLRRSKRHAPTEEPPVTLDNLVGERSGSKEARKQIREPVKETKEVPSGGENLRRSKRHASRDEPPFTLDNLVGGRTGRKEARKQKRQPVKVQEEGSAEIDDTVIEESVQRSLLDAHMNKKAAPGPVGGNAPQREKEIPKQPQTEKAILKECIKENERSKGPNVEPKDSIPEAVTIKEQCSLYVQLSIPEKECPPVGENMRRSRRNAAKHEFPMILENVVAATNGKQEARKRRRGPVNVQEERERSIKPRKEKKRSKNSEKENETEEPSLEAKDSFPEGVAIEQSSFYVELTISEQEGPPIGEKTRSESDASGHEPSIILDSVDGDTDKGPEGSNIQRRASVNVQQEVSAETDQTLIQEPLQQSVGNAYKTERAAPELLEEIAPQEEKETKELQKMQDISETPKADANSFPEELTTKEHSLKDQPTLSVQLILTENADSMVYQNPDETEVFVEDNIHKGDEPGKNSSLESYCRIENSPMEVNTMKQRKHLEPVKLHPSESVELLNDHTHSKSGTSPLDTAAVVEYASMSVESNKREMVEKHVSFARSEDQAAHFSDGARLSAGGAFTEKGPLDQSEFGETSEIFTDTDHCTLTNQSGDIDEPEDIQTGEVLSPGEQILGIKTTLTDVYEKDRSSGLLDPSKECFMPTLTDDTYERDPSNSNDMNEMTYGADYSAHKPDLDDKEEVNNVMKSGLTSVQREKSPARLTSLQRGAFDAEKIDETDRNVDQELTWDKIERIEKDKRVDDQHSSSERYKESNVPDTCIINPSSMPKGENLGDYSSKPADLLGLFHDSICTVSESENMSQTVNAESHEANHNLEGPDAREYSGTAAEKGDCFYPDYSMQNREMLEGLSNKTGTEKDFDQREQSLKMLNYGSTAKDGRQVINMDHGSEGDDIVGAESYRVVLASQDLAANTIGDRCADTEGDVSFDTKAKVEKDSRERCSGGESTAIRSMEKHTNKPTDVCSFVVAALPAFVLPPEGTIGTPGISISDDVHTCMMDSNKCKEGKEFSSLFATPVAISSAKEETRLYSHEGEISSDITPVERTISTKKDEQSCLSHVVFNMNEQGEAGGHETSLLDSTHGAQEERCHPASGQLDIQDLVYTQSSSCKHQYRLEPTDPLVSDNAFGDSKFVDDLSPRFETARDPLCCDIIKDDPEMMVLLESGLEEKQEIDVSIHASRKYEVSNEHEQDQEKDRIHSAENNAELGIQNLDAQYTIGQDILGSTEHNVADTTKFTDILPPIIVTSEGFSRSDTLIEDAELEVSVESGAENIEGTYGDAFAEQNTSIEQETDEEKEDIHSAQKNAKLDKKKIEDPQCSISKDLLRLGESDAADIMTLANDQSPSTETAHNTLQRGSLLNNGEQMAPLERVDTVEKSDDDDDAGRVYKALVGQEDDEKDEGDFAVKNAELDTRVVDPHSPICDPSVGLRESDVIFTGNLSSRVETADDALHSDSVNGAEMMAAVETGPEKSQEINDINDVAGREYNASIEQEDNEEKDWIHSTVRNAKLDIQDLVETQSCINKLDQELAESSHTVGFYTDLGSANTRSEASTDPLYHEILLDDAEMMAWLESGEEIIQHTDGDPAAGTEYMVSIEQEHGEYTNAIYSKKKNADLNIEDLDQKPSNSKDFLEFKECYVADTVKVSSDLKSAENSSLRTEDAGDTLHVDWLPEAATNQGALVEPLAVEVEETNTAADADSASQELMDSVEIEHDEEKDARDLAEIPIKSLLAATDQEMSSVAAEGGTTEEEKQISADVFPDQVYELKTEGLVSSELEGGDVADTCQHVHLQCNELLSPRIRNTCDSLHLDMATNKGEPSVLASCGINKPAFERPADMVVTDGKLSSETIKEFDGALEDEVVSRRKVDLMKGHNVVDPQETEGKAASPAKRKSMSVVRKNVRTILIHGTPNKVQMRGDMKENMASSKLDNVGNLTTVRPAKKRTALTDLQKK